MSPAAAPDWWQSFFDADYIRVWSAYAGAAESEHQAAALWKLLGLREGSRVLDAPCGYGRLSRLLAQRGAAVVGVDQAQALLDHAESTRGEIPGERLRYLLHDLRQPLKETGFDAAINIFSSLGYGSEDDDLAILRTLRSALRPGGALLVETNHRDAVVSFFARGGTTRGMRLQDGTLAIEEPTFDAVTGRVNTVWHWSGPMGSGHKAASLRVYSATELVALIARAGLRLRSVHNGCSPDPFKAEGPEMGGRLAVLADREGD